MDNTRVITIINYIVVFSHIIVTTFADCIWADIFFNGNPRFAFDIVSMSIMFIAEWVSIVNLLAFMVIAFTVMATLKRM